MWEREIQEGEREAIFVELMVEDVKELLDLHTDLKLDHFLKWTVVYITSKLAIDVLVASFDFPLLS